MRIDLLYRALEEAGLESPRAARYLVPPDGAPGRVLAMGLLPIPGPGLDGGEGRPRIAPFAALHRYRRLSGALKRSVRRIRDAAGLPKSSLRVFSNSRLPERSLAAALGLGWVGRNGLLMNREYGSSFLLGGILTDTAPGLFEDAGGLPAIIALDPPADPHAPCGACRACAAACPTDAIAPGGGIVPERCLQYLSTLEGPLPDFAERVWGDRLYGCQRCQEVCPVDRARTRREPPLPPEREFPDPALLLAAFAERPPRPLNGILPDTALEASWIPRDPILRNLLTACGRSGRPELIPLIRPFIDASPGWVAAAAAAAVERLEAAQSL